MKLLAKNERFKTPAYIRDRRGDSDAEIAERKRKAVHCAARYQEKYRAARPWLTRLAELGTGPAKAPAAAPERHRSAARPSLWDRLMDRIGNAGRKVFSAKARTVAGSV